MAGVWHPGDLPEGLPTADWGQILTKPGRAVLRRHTTSGTPRHGQSISLRTARSVSRGIADLIGFLRGEAAHTHRLQAE